MDMDVLLARLARELDSFAACLTGELSAPVAHCGDWTLHALADHVGRGNEWSTVAVTEQRGDYQPPAAPSDPADLAAWFGRGSAGLLEALAREPSQPAWTIWPPQTVGFWRRRRCLETLVHRWDAEHALGIKSLIDPALAEEGVAEVLDTMAPRQIKLGRTAGPSDAVRLRATDTGGSWVLGPGTPVATVSASAENLLLMLWRRLPADDAELSWEGDLAAGRGVVTGGLVP
jgi:uncharacterized protein (TIGR03083 family)